MKASIHRESVTTRLRSKFSSRHQLLVEAIDEIGVENLYEIELNARAGSTPGRFAYSGIAMRFLGDKGGEKDRDFKGADEVVDQLFELANAFEDQHGPQTFQAQIYAREKDGGKSTRSADRTFQTHDDPSVASERTDIGLETLKAQSSAMKDFQKTVSSVLKDLRETASAFREGGSLSGEAAAAKYHADVEILKATLEHKFDSQISTIIDARLEQLIGEIAPGLRVAIETEPTRNTLPERMREMIAEMTDEQREQLKDIVGEDLWKIVEVASTTETNVDFRSVLEGFASRWNEIEPKKREHMNEEMVRILPLPLVKRFFKTMREGGVL